MTSPLLGERAYRRLEGPSRAVLMGHMEYFIGHRAGIVLGWWSLAADDLAAGRLVTPLALRQPLGSAFYLVFPEADVNRPKVKAFREWIAGEAEPLAP